MRKVLTLLAALALSIGLFSPAEAARKHFSVSGHADNRKMDLDSSTGGNRSTKIKGKVRGGKVKGKKVVFYATNTDSAAKKRRYIGSAKINSKGKYSKTFKPSEGGSYLIEVVKKSGGGRSADTKKIRVEAFEWPILNHRFYDPAASKLVSRADKEQTGTGKAPNQRWSTSYAIQGTGKAVFDIAGFKCWRFNMKLAVSQRSPRDSAGTYVVAQGGRVIARGRASWGGTYWEPSRSVSEKLVSNLPLEVSIVPDAGVADPTAVRFILGNPKASCTYPTKSAPSH
ncbi:MAG: hypothetical protein ABW004_02935 [Aeromicrobium sp.]